MKPPIECSYAEDASGELWWCNSHAMRATHTLGEGRHVCDPKSGDIMIPCSCVNLTGDVELEPDD